MTLNDYLDSSGVTGKEFAALSGLTEASVSRIRKGEQNLSRDVMRRIILASGGLVTAEGLVADHAASDTTADEASSPGNADDLSAVREQAA